MKCYHFIFESIMSYSKWFTLVVTLRMIILAHPFMATLFMALSQECTLRKTLITRVKTNGGDSGEVFQHDWMDEET